MRRFIFIGMLCCVPIAAFSIAQPAQMLQAVGGFSCRGQSVCAEDPGRLTEAAELYDSAMQFLASSVGTLEGKPLAVFCSTPGCYAFTGESGSAAKTVGKFVIVVGPRAWKPYYLRHELIHRLQSERLGVAGMFNRPEWFVEGMAYALSQDPRVQLPEPFQSDRMRFLAWYATVGKERMWSTSLTP